MDSALSTDESPLTGRPRINREGSKLLLCGGWNMLGLASVMPVLQKKLEDPARENGSQYPGTGHHPLNNQIQKLRMPANPVQRRYGTIR